MSQLSVQVIAPVLTNFYHCMHCEQLFSQAKIGQQVHQEELDQYPEEVKQEFERLTDYLFDLAHRYGDQIHIRVIDPLSIEGFFKSLRYRVRKYPTFIVEDKKKITGWDVGALHEALQIQLALK
jgi:hypothetical protein